MKEETAQNIKTIKHFYKAIAEGKWAVARGLLDPDIDWVEPVEPTLWFSGGHFGPEAVFKEVIDATRDKFDKLQLKMKKFFAVGSSVVAIGAFHGWAKVTGKRASIPTIQVWTLANGKAVKYEGLHDLPAWKAAMGLPALVPEERVAA